MTSFTTTPTSTRPPQLTGAVIALIAAAALTALSGYTGASLAAEHPLTRSEASTMGWTATLSIALCLVPAAGLWAGSAGR